MGESQGAILFVWYENDLLNILKVKYIVSYAYDVVLAGLGKTWSESQNKLDHY